MDEYVLAAAFRRNKTKTLGGVEKLHCSDGHEWFPLHRFRVHDMCKRGERTLLSGEEVRLSRPGALSSECGYNRRASSDGRRRVALD
jgi:hypothetical protein